MEKLKEIFNKPKIKEFMDSPKKTAILGLIGSIVMLVCMLSYVRYFGISYLISFLLRQNLFSIAFITYFSIILIRMYKKKGNIKIANYVLIGLLIVNIFINVILASYANMVYKIVAIVINLIIILYLLNIIFRKPTKINNKCFAIILVIYTIFNILSSGFTLLVIIYYIGYISIIPYFYNYYKLLEIKDEMKMSKQQKNILIVVSVIITLVLFGYAISEYNNYKKATELKENYEREISTESDTNTTTTNTTTKKVTTRSGAINCAKSSSQYRTYEYMVRGKFHKVSRYEVTNTAAVEYSTHYLVTIKGTCSGYTDDYNDDFNTAKFTMELKVYKSDGDVTSAGIDVDMKY